jgi:hypothetical protein
MTITVIALLLLLSPQTLRPQATRFTAEISRGQDFEREFGAGLLFRLRASKDPQTPGWTIEVRPKAETNPEVEYSWVVTPPYRFFNPRYLEVSYGFSAKQIVEINPRDFNFVINRADYDAGAEAVRKLLWPVGIDDAQLDRARKVLDELPTCHGTLRILDSRVGNSIEWLRFEVELCP